MSGERSQNQWLELVLAQLKSDMSRLDDRQQEYLVEVAARGQLLQTVNDNVQRLTQIVSVGNGQPALLVQVSDLKRDVCTIKDHQEDMKTKLDEIKSAIENKPTTAQKAERWKAVAVIAGGTFALIPGLLALFGVHL